MKPLAIAWIGASFAIDVVLGLIAGNYVAGRTGHSWWVIIGLLGGFVVGATGAVMGFRKALR
ncbi:MAG: hypothetical protein NVSMB64_19290 [Candidatus Velthaea sp.]